METKVDYALKCFAETFTPQIMNMFRKYVKIPFLEEQAIIQL